MIPRVVLMIDDELHSFDRVRRYLDQDMYRLYHASDPFQGVDLAKQLKPDVIILDIRMPEIDGYDVCQRLRNHEATQHVPIIIYSVLGGEDEAYIRGLNLGAHAVVKKGKLSRLGATLERFVAEKEEREEEKRPRIYEFRRQGHVLKIQGEAERVWLDGEEKILRPLCRKLLACLAKHPGVLISSEEIAQEVYGTDWEYAQGRESIHRLIHDLRAEVEPIPDQRLFIDSVRRVGYRLLGEDEEA